MTAAAIIVVLLAAAVLVFLLQGRRSRTRSLGERGGALGRAGKDGSAHALSPLATMEGTLKLTANASLSTLAGLENLHAINGTLDIFGCSSLISVDGLEGLRDVAEETIIDNNGALVDLDALLTLESPGNPLDQVAGTLAIKNNESLCRSRA